jgi:hypothetical protein
MKDAAHHSRTVIEALPDPDRATRLHELEAAISRRVSVA